MCDINKPTSIQSLMLKLNENNLMTRMLVVLLVKLLDISEPNYDFARVDEKQKIIKKFPMLFEIDYNRLTYQEKIDIANNFELIISSDGITVQSNKMKHLLMMNPNHQQELYNLWLTKNAPITKFHREEV